MTERRGRDYLNQSIWAVALCNNAGVRQVQRTLQVLVFRNGEVYGSDYVKSRQCTGQERRCNQPAQPAIWKDQEPCCQGKHGSDSRELLWGQQPQYDDGNDSSQPGAKQVGEIKGADPVYVLHENKAYSKGTQEKGCGKEQIGKEQSPDLRWVDEQQ